QVIPYEFFAGDGMLTRLLLKASDKAPWSDNGTAKNPALSPLGENVNTKGQYFYEVDLNGNTVGKQGQALIDQLRANGDYTYDATVKVYGNKDGKPDLTNLIATRDVKIHLNKVSVPGTPSTSTNTTQDMKANETKAKEDMMKKDNMSTLPETGETATNTAALGAFSAAFAFILGTLGLKAKKERN
ncbi:MAG: fibronectin-binding SSURE repeat-containing protein, partial [Granulicatella sp.]|nr:fibronectin-binding SSURE repeat-containing protein [Granulicatella sp.]